MRLRDPKQAAGRGLNPTIRELTWPTKSNSYLRRNQIIAEHRAKLAELCQRQSSHDAARDPLPTCSAQREINGLKPRP
jgi:hypothetical protein